MATSLIWSLLPLLPLGVVAIVPTTLGGKVAHGRSGRLTWPGGVGAQWSASRREQVREERLVWMLRAITLVLALDSGRRPVGLLWFEAQGITLQKPGSSS